LIRVGVVGANGFLGGEVVRLLHRHPFFQISTLASGSHTDMPIGEVRASLVGLDHQLEQYKEEHFVDRCDAVVLALPHGKSREIGISLAQRGIRVVDLGSDFRLNDDGDYQRWYGRELSASTDGLNVRYCLPEVCGGPDEDTQVVANPGCFATAITLALAPLVGSFKKGASVPIFGVTGSSGSGRTPTETVHHSLRTTNFVAYKPLTHQHLGEVQQTLSSLGDVPTLDFIPHSAPLARGIHLTMRIKHVDLDADIFAAMQRYYADAQLVHVFDRPVQLGAVIGSCSTHIGVVSHGGRSIVTVAIDNLLKGGSGQAVQNLNIWFGRSPIEGLPVLGVWP